MVQKTRFTEPELLSPEHGIDLFDCGQAQLNDWLKKRALKNMKLDATRVYVVCPVGERVPAGWYGISTASISVAKVVGRMRRNMPDPIPCILLGRLAVDSRWQGQGLGSALLADCMERALQLSDIGAARLLITHPIDDLARDFYIKHDFIVVPGDRTCLALDLGQVRAALRL